MAINVNVANNQAEQLNNNVTQLRTARKQMLEYRASISANWQAKEASYILTAIDRVVGDIDSAIRNLNSLSSDIKSVAAQIKREEDAAAAAARAKAAQQQRLREAQNAYDDAQEELSELIDEKEKVEEKYKKASFFERLKLQNDLRELEEKIDKAEDNLNKANDALRAARR